MKKLNTLIVQLHSEEVDMNNSIVILFSITSLAIFVNMIKSIKAFNNGEISIHSLLFWIILTVICLIFLIVMIYNQFFKS